MDFWVVVAAASAGCLAKRLQRSSIGRDGASKLSYNGISSSGNRELHDYTAQSFARRKKLENYAYSDRGNGLNKKVFDASRSDCDSAADRDYPYRVDDQTSSRNSAECNGPSAARLPAEVTAEQTETLDEDRIIVNNNNCDSSEVSSSELPGAEMPIFHGSAKNRSVLRSRYLRGQHLKPQTSLESCLMAQLYNYHAEMEDISLHPLTPPASPNIATDGSSIIAGFSEPSERQSRAEVKKKHRNAANDYPEKVRAVLGVPPLPKVGCSRLSKQVQNRTGKAKSLVGPGGIINEMKIRARNGPPAGNTSLCIGISLGIIFSITANKEEVDKLKALLKQTENLVQDLQEELEMRDSLTVKELASENYESLDTRNNSVIGTAPSLFSPEHCIQNPTEDNGKQTSAERAGKSPDSMTRIEAELEAELERLGLNLKTANLERRFSDAELDPDFEADFAVNEFRAERDFPLRDADYEDSSGTSTTRTVNYAVSPRELSLRLHEVVQSRLEERIEELELALQNSQRKVQLLQSSASKSRRRNPAIKDLRPHDPHSPYDVACEEVVKFESKEEVSPTGLQALTHRECSEMGQSKAQEIDDMLVIGYERSDVDADDAEKLLIKQIIERTKKGSPVVVNALLSIDEDVE